jgi:ribosomal protein S18 acetylase RimI-like enzyme
VELVPAASYSHAELAAAFTAGYAGYYLPLAVDEASFRFMAVSWDYDLDASRVARDGGESVGLAMLARRGAEGWIGGVGVVPERRAEGLGRRLMDAVAEQARGRGVERLWLEVLVQNAPAIGLYEKLGYRRTRELETWSLDTRTDERREATPIDVGEALGRAVGRLPWQRADATVRNVGDARALATEDGTLIYRVTAGTASLFQLAADDEDAVGDVLAALPDDVTAVRYLNGPTGDPVNAALQSLSAQEIVRQHELVLVL